MVEREAASDSGVSAAFDALADRRVFQLDDVQWAAFMAALDWPPEDNPRLRNALPLVPARALPCRAVRKFRHFVGVVPTVHPAASHRVSRSSVGNPVGSPRRQAPGGPPQIGGFDRYETLRQRSDRSVASFRLLPTSARLPGSTMSAFTTFGTASPRPPCRELRGLREDQIECPRFQVHPVAQKCVGQS
jgi:Protein of unknown function (DUF1778)